MSEKYPNCAYFLQVIFLNIPGQSYALITQHIYAYAHSSQPDLTSWWHARLFFSYLKEEFSILVFHHLQERGETRLTFCTDDVDHTS